jgi:hypothetical protein
MKALKGRLHKLESTITIRMREPRPPTEEDIRLGDAFQELFKTAPPVVEAEVNDWAISRRGYQPREASSLVYAVLDCVWEHMERGTPLAMPAEVAEVYINSPEARPLHECEDCGYAVPYQHANPLAVPPAPVRIHFERCPLCGGKVGYWAYRMKRQREQQASA